MRVVDGRRGKKVPKGHEDLVTMLEELPLPGFVATVLPDRVKLRKVGKRVKLPVPAKGEGGGSETP